MTIGVIICDDHPAFARGLAALLRDEASDFDPVGVAFDADEAERLAGEGPPDVVLMDIRLPGVDGVEATRRIRAISPSTKVVMLTASDEQADLYKALRAGASGYLLKESDVDEIITAIRSVMRGHLVIPAHLVRDIVIDLEAQDPKALSDVEREILSAIARGLTNKEIAARLHVSERTVKRRVEDVYAKLHLTDRLEAAVYAAQQGIDTRSRSGP
jgi:DNA-binding NarL/FixJ family response regulator